MVSGYVISLVSHRCLPISHSHLWLFWVHRSSPFAQAQDSFFMYSMVALDVPYIIWLCVHLCFLSCSSCQSDALHEVIFRALCSGRSSVFFGPGWYILEAAGSFPCLASWGGPSFRITQLFLQDTMCGVTFSGLLGLMPCGMPLFDPSWIHPCVFSVF